MTIAVTYESGQIFQHFGHAQAFKLYDVKDGEVTEARVLPTDGCGHGALAGFLKAHGADTLICGGLGGGARAALAEAGIRVYGGASGDADAAVQALLRGELAYDPDATCTHHGQKGGHSCEHGESHTCGHEGGRCGH